MLNFSSLPATQTDLDQFLTFFSRKFQSFSEKPLSEFLFSGKLLKDFQKIPNSNNHFYLSISNEWSCRIPALYLLPDRLRQIFDHFSRKFQRFSGKLLSVFQKIANLNIN
jgi:hypothetical protein